MCGPCAGRVKQEVRERLLPSMLGIAPLEASKQAGTQGAKSECVREGRKHGTKGRDRSEEDREAKPHSARAFEGAGKGHGCTTPSPSVAGGDRQASFDTRLVEEWL